MTRSLGRRVPTDWEHVEKYPLSSGQALALAPTPVAIGVNWYAAFDEPTQDAAGHWWASMPRVGEQPRGGHCVCLKQRGVRDLTAWWVFYNQGREGACVGFGCSRVMTLMNRKRYFARWLWDRAKEIDEWAETNPGDGEGTSVRAALRVMRDHGHVPWSVTQHSPLNDEPSDHLVRGALRPTQAEGISAYRWIRSVDDLLEVLGYQGLDYVDVLNSWGRSYPHLVRFPVEVVERLWHEDGEFGVIVDR